MVPSITGLKNRTKAFKEACKYYEPPSIGLGDEEGLRFLGFKVCGVIWVQGSGSEQEAPRVLG